MAYKDQFILEAAYLKIHDPEAPGPDSFPLDKFETVPRRPATGTGVDNGPEAMFSQWASKNNVGPDDAAYELIKKAFAAGYNRCCE
jgi:hypothetical protein